MYQTEKILIPFVWRYQDKVKKVNSNSLFYLIISSLSQVIVFLSLLMLTVGSTTSPRRCTMTVLL